MVYCLNNFLLNVYLYRGVVVNKIDYIFCFWRVYIEWEVEEKDSNNS